MSGSSDEEEFLLTLLLYRKRRRNKRSNRQQWVRPVFSQRLYQGAFHHLVQELRLSDPEYHFRYFRTFKPKQRAVFICLLILKAKNKDLFSSPSKRLRGEVKFCSSRAVRMRCGTQLNADLAFSVHMMTRRLPQPHREVTRRSVNPP